MNNNHTVPEFNRNTKHPVGLPVLFFTEMWERFSFYGMRALLVLYLVNSLHYQRGDALSIYATYTGLVYLTPILGGYLADRWLGLRRAILVGGVVMALGHFAMAFPPLLHIGLGLLIVGNGFFKPNISTLVGSLYEQQDPRRDAGFTIFYMGINIGAFFGTVIAGFLAEKFGWHWGFGAAGVGMVIGLIVFVVGQGRLAQTGLLPNQRALAPRDAWIVMVVSIAAVALVLLGSQAGMLVAPLWISLSGLVKFAIGAALLIAMFGYLFRATDNSEENDRLKAILVMAFFVIFFWMGFEQAGGTMSLFADKQTDRHLFGAEIPASYFQALNPLFIFLLAPFFSVFWTRLDRSAYALATPTKQAIGMIILGLGFIVLAVAQQRADAGGPVNMTWLVMVFLLHTIGELCLSPIGLSMVTKLAPAKLAALMMGLWFGATALANYLAGMLESYLAGSGVPLYWFLVGSSIGAGVVMLVLTPLLKKWMHGQG